MSPVCGIFFSALLKMRWFSHSKIGRKRMTELISQSVNYEGVWRTSQATPGLLNMVNFKPFFLPGRMSQPTVSTEQTWSLLCTTGKVKVPCHPCQLNRLCWQRQADPQDHGGQREQEGAKEMSGFSFHKDSRTTVGGRSLTLQVSRQVKKRRKEK